MEGYYSSDDDIAIGPVTLNEIRRDLTIRSKKNQVQRRETFANFTCVLDSSSESKRLPSKEELRPLSAKPERKITVPDLLIEAAAQLDFSINSEYFTPNVTTATNENENADFTQNILTSKESFISKVSEVLNNDTCSSSVYLTAQNTLVKSDESRNLDFTFLSARPSTLIVNADCGELVDNTIIISSDEEDECDDLEEKIEEIIDILDEDILNDKYKSDSVRHIKKELKNDSTYDFKDDDTEDLSSSEMRESEHGIQTESGSSQYDYYSESKENSVEEHEEYNEKEELDSLKSYTQKENMAYSIDSLSSNLKHDESYKNLKIRKESYQSEHYRNLKHDTQDEFLKEAANASFNSKDTSLEYSDNLQNEDGHPYIFNDTLEEMDFLLKGGLEGQASETKTFSNKQMLELPTFELPTTPLFKVKPFGSQNSPKTSAEKKANQKSAGKLISRIPKKYDTPSQISRNAYSPKDASKFKVPARPSPLTKTPSIKTAYRKNIISPVGVYIKNSPSVPIKRNVHATKAPKNLMITNEFKVAEKENLTCDLPEVVYKPSKKIVVTNKEAITLPGSIQKLIPQSPHIIKHEGRIIKSQKPANLIHRKLMENDLTLSMSEDSILNSTQDVSVLTVQKAYIQ